MLFLEILYEIKYLFKTYDIRYSQLGEGVGFVVGFSVGSAVVGMAVVGEWAILIICKY